MSDMETLSKLQEQIDELRAKLEGKKNTECIPWKPYGKEQFFFLIDNHCVGDSSASLSKEEDLHSSGNIFRTEEQAEAHAKRRAALNYLQLIADQLNGEVLWRPTKDVPRFFIFCDNHKQIAIAGFFLFTPCSAFKSIELAKEALSLLPPQHRKELFGDAKGDWE